MTENTMTKDSDTTNAAMTPPADHVPVLVTTAHHGVFCGYILPEELEALFAAAAVQPQQPTQLSLVLRHVRNCLYWARVTRGFHGLANQGPGALCRVGPAVPRQMLRDVNSVTEMTAAAAAAWEAEPWAE